MCPRHTTRFFHTMATPSPHGCSGTTWLQPTPPPRLPRHVALQNSCHDGLGAPPPPPPRHEGSVAQEWADRIGDRGGAGCGAITTSVDHDHRCVSATLWHMVVAAHAGTVCAPAAAVLDAGRWRTACWRLPRLHPHPASASALPPQWSVFGVSDWHLTLRNSSDAGGHRHAPKGHA